MPECTVDEHCEPLPTEGEIWLAREILPMAAPATNAECVQGAAEEKLRPCIPALHPRHHAAAYLGCVYVGQELFLAFLRWRRFVGVVGQATLRQRLEPLGLHEKRSA